MKLPQKILAKILLPPKIPESKISNPKKSFNHPCHLKSGVPPEYPPLGLSAHPKAFKVHITKKT